MGNVIESSNFAWMLISLVGVFYTCRWRYRNVLTDHTDQIVRAWTWVFTASGINHGWFATSRFLSEDGVRWHPIMFEYRWVIIVITSCMFVYGMATFFRLIEQFSNARMLAIVGIVALCSFIVGFA